MAIAANTIWEYNSAATSVNANGGGFNPSNANMLTDLACDAGTGNTASPVVSSASYSFVAGDVNNWVYVKSGTNWTPGFYRIASVASGKATLDAAVGNAEQLINGFYGPNTADGCATTGTPTGGTFSVDYSRLTTCISTTAVSDYGAVGASTTLTSATAAFTPVMVGNIFYQSTTGTGAFGTIGRYEIVSYTNPTTVVLDRAPNGGTASVACTGKIGGALSLMDNTLINTAIAGNTLYIKSGTYTTTANTTIAAGSIGTSTAPVYVIGYDSKRGDNPKGSTRPLLAVGAWLLTTATYWVWKHLVITGSNTWVLGANNGVAIRAEYVKAINTSTTAARTAFQCGNSPLTLIGCEGISYRGAAASAGGPYVYNGCWFHDSDTGMKEVAGAVSMTIVNTIVSACVTAAISKTAGSTSNTVINGLTLVGSPSKRGIGISMPAATVGVNILNTIIYGFVTGINVSGGVYYGFGDYNNYYNNTTDTVNWNKGANDVAIDPAFVNLVERSGSTATTISGNKLVQTGAQFQTWGITAGVDYVYISGGTGVTAGMYGILSVDSETQITVDLTLTANATADKVWSIVQGGNFLPTGDL